MLFPSPQSIHPDRKKNRLAGFDYSSPGYYFVTICVKDRVECFGEVVGETMILNDIGKIVKFCWFDLVNHYRNVVLDEFVIMPNHVHGIIEIIDNYVIGIDVGTGLKPVPTSIVPTPATVVNVLGHSLSEIIRGFKTFSSRRINEIVFFRWQRSFYDRIIRDADAYQKIKLYIQDNPINWELDRNNPFNHHV